MPAPQTLMRHLKRGVKDFHWMGMCPIFALLGLCFLPLLAGCYPSIFIKDVSLPAPLNDDFPYQLQGKPLGIFGANHFQFRTDGRLHYVVLAGVDAPPPGSTNYASSLEEMIRLINGRRLQIQVVGRDSHEREIAVVTLVNSSADSKTLDSDISYETKRQDVGLEIIRRGYGWYDGREFAQSVAYQQAEAEAKSNRIGIWATLESASRSANEP